MNIREIGINKIYHNVKYLLNYWIDHKMFVLKECIFYARQNFPDFSKIKFNYIYIYLYKYVRKKNLMLIERTIKLNRSNISTMIIFKKIKKYSVE